jgi:hypothetical protein
MTKRTKAQWQALIEAHKQSGQMAAAFCREHQINPKYFSLRRRQLADGEVERSPQFIPVSMTKGTLNERINLRDPSGAVVELPASISPQWLAQLLHALRA